MTTQTEDRLRRTLTHAAETTTTSPDALAVMAERRRRRHRWATWPLAVGIAGAGLAAIVGVVSLSSTPDQAAVDVEPAAGGTVTSLPFSGDPTAIDLSGVLGGNGAIIDTVAEGGVHAVGYRDTGRGDAPTPVIVTPRLKDERSVDLQVQELPLPPGFEDGNVLPSAAMLADGQLWVAGTAWPRLDDCQPVVDGEAGAQAQVLATPANCGPVGVLWRGSAIDGRIERPVVDAVTPREGHGFVASDIGFMPGELGIVLWGSSADAPAGRWHVAGYLRGPGPGAWLRLGGPDADEPVDVHFVRGAGGVGLPQPQALVVANLPGADVDLHAFSLREEEDGMTSVTHRGPQDSGLDAVDRSGRLLVWSEQGSFRLTAGNTVHTSVDGVDWDLSDPGAGFGRPATLAIGDVGVTGERLSVEVAEGQQFFASELLVYGQDGSVTSAPAAWRGAWTLRCPNGGTPDVVSSITGTRGVAWAFGYGYDTCRASTGTPTMWVGPIREP